VSASRGADVEAPEPRVREARGSRSRSAWRLGSVSTLSRTSLALVLYGLGALCNTLSWLVDGLPWLRGALLAVSFGAMLTAVFTWADR
jgi:hypothetical protein